MTRHNGWSNLEDRFDMMASFIPVRMHQIQYDPLCIFSVLLF